MVRIYYTSCAESNIGVDWGLNNEKDVTDIGGPISSGKINGNTV